jgi:hypothetical protein
MFQTDTIHLQTKSSVNTNGSIKNTWTQSTAISCDVQDINKEYVYKTYGLTDEGEYKQVFDYNGSAWVKGDQVKYNNQQWLIALVNSNMSKINLSNHTFIIIRKVI